MKRLKKGMAGLLGVLLLFGMAGLSAQAKEEERILPGIYIEDMSMEGKTAEEARSMVEDYVAKLSAKNISLITVNDNEVVVTPADVGFTWTNTEIIDEVASIGQKGNIVERYKAKKDLQFENKIYQLEFTVDQELIKNLLTQECAVFNVEAENATLSREEDQFIIHPGVVGCVIDEEASLDRLSQFLTEEWDGTQTEVELVAITEQPLGSEEELSQVRDVLGTFSTSFKSSGYTRSENVRNGCRLIDGITLYPGEEFSTYDIVSPFTEANGYYMAGSYLNGQVVDSLGGGICQVSTTLYNAVLLAELEVTERHNHSMIVTYVDPSADAAISESAGKDFRFKNNTQAPIYIEGITTDEKQITFNIYGAETRDAAHKVVYKSEIISTTYPDTEVIYTDPALPVGSIDVQSAHIGYKANLWKITYENEQEVSREMVNSSVYKMVPRYATVGVATEDPNVYNELMAAISTNNIDHVKAVVAALAAAAAPPAEVPPAEAPAAPQEAPAQ